MARDQHEQARLWGAGEANGGVRGCAHARRDVQPGVRAPPGCAAGPGTVEPAVGHDGAVAGQPQLPAVGVTG